MSVHLDVPASERLMSGGGLLNKPSLTSIERILNCFENFFRVRIFDEEIEG
jgi:hypothetical protein